MSVYPPSMQRRVAGQTRAILGKLTSLAPSMALRPYRGTRLGSVEAASQHLQGHSQNPSDLRKRRVLEKRPVVPGKAKPQASRHAVAPEAPNYAERGTPASSS